MGARGVMSVCDVCNAPAIPGSKQYTADQMRAAVQVGFRPPKATIDRMAQTLKMLGLPDETAASAFVTEWASKVQNDSTDWMLCPSCQQAAEAALKNARPKGYCAFCKQPLSPTVNIAMLSEAAVNQLVSLGAIGHPGPPSGKDNAGTFRWVACMTCMESIKDRAQRLQGS